MGTYATQTDLTNRFGSVNIGKWSQLDPSQNNSTIDTSRVAEAIAQAEKEIDDRFRGGPYQIPLTANASGALSIVVQWTCALAAVWLYRSRSWDSSSDQASMLEALELKVHDEINAYLLGSRQLDCALASSYTTFAPEVGR